MLLLNNVKVYIASSSKERAEASIAQLMVETRNVSVHFLPLDLASLVSIRSAVDIIRKRETELHLLFNNAGEALPQAKAVTTDGYDLVFGTNCLGHYFLTLLLLPLLLQKPGGARVINISSEMHRWAPEVVPIGHTRDTSAIVWNKFKNVAGKEQISETMRYAYSKLGLLMLTTELSKRYGCDGLISVATAPGIIGLESYPHESRRSVSTTSHSMNSAAMAAITSLYAATVQATYELNGAYFLPGAKVGVPRNDATDTQNCEELWSWVIEQVKGY